MSEHRLSPRTKAKFNLIEVSQQQCSVSSAQLKEDSQGRIPIDYKRTIPVDESKAHKIQVGKNAHDTTLLVDACLDMLEAIKRKQVPIGANRGVVIDQTKVGIGDQGQYEEGQQFTRTKEVLGKGNCAGDIVVVEDKETGTEHALKTVMISVFSTNEVRCWVGLGDSDHFPSLYLFRLDGNKVALHMEKVEHGGNVMITKDAMKVKILDFGMAQPLKEGLKFNHDALKNDILCVIRLFCGMYIGNDFERRDKLESQIKAGTLEKELETAPLSEEDREELLQLIMMTYQVTQNPQQAGYGSTAPVMECIEDKLSRDEMRDVKRQAMEILFPDFYRADGDINLRKGEEEAVDEESDDFDQEATGKAIPDDFQGLSIISDEDV